LDSLVDALRTGSYSYEGRLCPNKLKKGIGCVGGVVCDEQVKGKLVVLGHHQCDGATYHYGWNKNENNLEDLVKQMKEEQKVYCSCLCACVYTRGCLEEIVATYKEPIDENLQHYYGCTDLGMKMYSLGWVYGFVKSAFCWRKALTPAASKNQTRKLREESNRRVTILRFYKNPTQLLQKHKEKRSGDTEISNVWQQIETRAAEICKKTQYPVSCLVGESLE